MKVISIGLFLLLVTAAVAEAQSYGGGSAYDDGYLTLRATTPAESYARGIADLVRSQGRFNRWSAEAAIQAAKARRREMENAAEWIEGYFDIRRLNREYRAAERGPRLSREELLRYSRAGEPKRLSPSQFSAVTGRVTWPILLRTERFAADRAELEGLFARRAAAGTIASQDYLKVLQAIEEMKAALKARVRQLPPGDYVLAKRFLRGLAAEARGPVALHPALAQLR